MNIHDPQAADGTKPARCQPSERSIVTPRASTGPTGQWERVSGAQRCLSFDRDECAKSHGESTQHGEPCLTISSGPKYSHGARFGPEFTDVQQTPVALHSVLPEWQKETQNSTR